MSPALGVLCLNDVWKRRKIGMVQALEGKGKINL
jgi:hypothetical protein